MSKISKLKRASIFALCMMLTVAFMPINSFAYAANTEAEPDYAQMETMQVDEKGEVNENADVKAIKDSVSDETVYNPLYFMKHGNSDYVNMDDIRMSDFAEPVTVARGVASYNYEKQKEFEFGKNSIAAMNYEIPVYDLDKNSDYYVAFPNTNLNSDKIGSYDFVLTYNNDFGEVINDVIYENNIAYIKKDVVDNPKNEMALQPGGVIAMQVNYYFKSIEKEKPFSKKIPVQVLEGDTPDYKTIEVENMFAEDAISFPLGDYDVSKIHVMMNGSVLPINEDAYFIDEGILTIRSSAAVVSSINITVDETTVAEKAINLLTDKASAVTPAGMKYYKAKNGKEVVLSGVSDIYVGWRGHYRGAVPIKFAHVHTNKPDNDEWEVRMSALKKLPEWLNSLEYMYGAKSTGTTTSDQSLIGYWALNSYTKGKDADTGTTINRDTEYNNPLDSSGTKKTMYNWMKYWAKNLELGNGKTSIGNYDQQGIYIDPNGLGGFNNFAIPWPKSKITGNARNLISDSNADGYGKGNVNITFDAATESGKTVLGAEDYMAGSCAHIEDSATNNGDYENASARYTVYVSCLAKADDYVVLCFACASPNTQEGMGIYKFRTGTPVKVKKTSASGAITDSNGCYDFNGSTFKFYESEADAKANRDVVATFKTNAKGETEEQMMAPGTYYIVETSPGKGYSVPDAYKASNGGKKVTVSGTDTVTFTVANVPQVGNIIMEKLDDTVDHKQGNAKLINTGFLVKYYDGQYTTKEAAEASGAATRTWHMKTTDLGNDKYGLDFSNPKHYEGYSAGENGEGTFYNYPSGNYVAPIGTYVIEEFATPEGYNKSNEVKVVNVKEDPDNKPVIADVKPNFKDSVMRGGIRVVKHDDETNEGLPQGDASLQGAEFTIVNKSAESVVVPTVIDSVASNFVQIDWANESAKKAAIANGTAKEVQPGGVVGKITTDGKGIAYTEKKALPYGTYEITETKAPYGYDIDTGFKHTIEFNEKSGVLIDGKKVADAKDGVVAETESLISKDGENKDTPTYAQDKVKRAGLQLVKRDNDLDEQYAQGDATLENAEFKIVNKSNKTVVVRDVPYLSDAEPTVKWGDGKQGQNIALLSGQAKRVAPDRVVGYVKTAKDGYTKTLADDLPVGKYEVTESKPSKGYKLDTTFKLNITVRDEDKGKILPTDAKANTAQEEVIRGGVQVKKYDNDLFKKRKEYAQGDATLEGAEFTIVNRSAHDVVVRDVPYLSRPTPTVDWKPAPSKTQPNTKRVKPGEVVGVIKTDAKGYTSTLANDLPFGRYSVTETKAPEGYKIDTTFLLNITIDESRENKLTPTDVEAYVAEDPVIRGDVYIEKWDKELNKSEALGGKGHDASKHTGTDLNGIQFTIKNVSKHAVVTPKVIDPKASGYKGDAYWTAKDVGKWNIKYGVVDALEQGTAQEVEPGGVVGIITTHWNEQKKAYEAHTGGMSLPYGTYEITETKTNKFYELTDKAKRTIEIRKDGTVVDKTKEANPLVWKDYVYRQNIAFEKKLTNLEDINKRAQYIPFKVTNRATGEYTYVVVNQNGQYNSWTHPHSRNTNGYDKYIDSVVKQGGEVDSNKLKEIMLGDEIDKVAPGTWFSLGEDGTRASVNDEFAAFPYGTYDIEEVRCTNNRGYKLIKPDPFEVKQPDRGFVNQNINPKDVGVEFNVTNTPKVPIIGTTAKDSKTGIDLGIVGKEVTIVDTVKYEDLNEGQEYKLVGILMDKSTGKSLKVGGKEVTSTKTFTPKEEDGTINVEFKLNTESLKGKDIVVYEKLFTNEGGKEVQKTEHEEIDDMGQTVHIPDMGTTAADVKTGTNVGAPNEKTEIVDKVAYKNLTEGKEYTVKGVLMDKATGKPIKDGDKEVRAEKKFKAETSDGEVELTFTFNASALQGQAVVAFEHLYYNGIEVVAHADINDEGQIVRETINREHTGPWDFLNTYIINIYPDTTCWVNDFPNADNESYMRYYFSNAAYNDYPVVGVTWEQANAFCAWRTEYLLRGLGAAARYVQRYRLPTEAEWEYAARGKDQNEFPWENEDVASGNGCFYANFKPDNGNYTKDGNLITSRTGIYSSNSNGLYDMAGNVAEWCSTIYTEAGVEAMNDINPQLRYNAAKEDPYRLKKKSVRGGSWKDPESYIRSAWRSYEYQNQPRSYIGFRCVRSLANTTSDKVKVKKGKK